MPSALKLLVQPLLSDNYAYLVHDLLSGQTAAIDPSEAKPILKSLQEKNWQLTHIFSTHHHWDHTGGNLALKQATGCEVVGYTDDAERIPGITQKVEDGQRFAWGGETVEVLFIPGHTLGHIAYYFPQSGWVFCGDTLFSLGCGRLFEGTAEQMYASLQRLAALPDDTKVYCGHEYTEANGQFAITVEPDNLMLQQRMAEVKRLRAQALPTIPSTIRGEKATNPFLRATSAEVFAEIRKKKDAF